MVTTLLRRFQWPSSPLTRPTLRPTAPLATLGLLRAAAAAPEELLTYHLALASGPTPGAVALWAAATALALASFGALLGARRPVEAIFGFLVYLLALLLPFFGLGADYVGAIHLMVYPGAILIGFVFATLTTDQKGHWDQWRRGAGGRAGLWLALPLLLLWGPAATAANSATLATGPLAGADDGANLAALGLEIFGRRLLSLNLLGLLLTVAFLAALRLLAPPLAGHRPGPALLPRLGALAFSLVAPLGGDGYLPPALTLVALGLAALAGRRYGYLHSFLVLEGLGLALNLLFVAAGATGGSLEGEVLVLFGVAVAAAETAVGLSLFLALVLGAAPVAAAATLRRSRAAALRGRRRALLVLWVLPAFAPIRFPVSEMAPYPRHLPLPHPTLGPPQITPPSQPFPHPSHAAPLHRCRCFCPHRPLPPPHHHPAAFAAHPGGGLPAHHPRPAAGGAAAEPRRQLPNPREPVLLLGFRQP
jgi:NADH:ubiquinone oxidoreductase subunit 6 (subunit J)/NADH:ubiquinone oxidoreductase subunit K